MRKKFLSPEDIKSAAERAQKGKNVPKGMPTDTWVKGVADLAESKKPPEIDQVEVDRALNDAVELSRSQVGTATHVFEIIPMEQKGKRLVQLNFLFMRATINARIVSTFARERNNYSVKWCEDYCQKYLKHLSMVIEVLYNIKKLDVGYSQE